MRSGPGGRRCGEGARRKWVDVGPIMARNVGSAPVQAARGIGEGFVRSKAFEVLSRARFVARGLIYGIHRALRVRSRRQRHREADEPAGRDPDRGEPAVR